MENIYSLDGRVPLLKSIPFGLQHVLAMFVANIAPIMIVTGAGILILAGIFPDIIRTIFAENCVAVVFLAAIIMNLIIPKDSEA